MANRFFGVGVGSYDAYKALPLAVSDVDAFRKLLGDGFAGDPMRDPDETTVLTRLRELAAAVPGDGALVLLWSGHGQAARKGLRLLTTDSGRGPMAGIEAAEVAGHHHQPCLLPQSRQDTGQSRQAIQRGRPPHRRRGTHRRGPHPVPAARHHQPHRPARPRHHAQQPRQPIQRGGPARRCGNGRRGSGGDTPIQGLAEARRLDPDRTSQWINKLAAIGRRHPAVLDLSPPLVQPLDDAEEGRSD